MAKHLRARLDALRQLSSVLYSASPAYRSYATTVHKVVRTQFERATAAYDLARNRLGENFEFGEMYQQGRAALHNMQIAIENFESQQEEGEDSDKLAYELLARCHQLGRQVEDSLGRLEQSVHVG